MHGREGGRDAYVPERKSIIILRVAFCQPGATHAVGGAGPSAYTRACGNRTLVP